MRGLSTAVLDDAATLELSLLTPRLPDRLGFVEEFVSAFRSYVHRDHVFVPTTQPVAAGRTVRLTITLADHTPVLAGEVEVLSPSTIPPALAITSLPAFGPGSSEVSTQTFKTRLENSTPVRQRPSCIQ